jgi:hypothetical protein
MFFSFPADARWNEAVEFGVEIGEYTGIVRVPRRVSSVYFPSGSLPSAASRRTISNGRGSRASPSGNCAAGS